MPAGTEVRPGRWRMTDDEVLDLYDNDEYSAVWGTFVDPATEQPSRCLGVRWNGDAARPGYPNQGRNPLWYVEPHFLTEYIMTTLLSRVVVEHGPSHLWVTHLRTALLQFREDERMRHAPL